MRRYLERDGLDVEVAADGHVGAGAGARPTRRTLVVLDLMLPGICPVWRSAAGCAPGAGDAVPIVMLTALGEESDRVLGLELGADDYVTKPFSPRELALRVQAVLRRSREPAGRIARRCRVDGDLRRRRRPPGVATRWPAGELR